MEAIKHNNYSPGFQSLESIGLDGRRFTVGIIHPGQPYPCETEEEQHMVVTDDGLLRVGFDGTFKLAFKLNPVTVPAGYSVELQAIGVAVSYLCVYGKIPCMKEAEIRQLLRGKSGKPFAFVLKSGYIDNQGYARIIEPEHNRKALVQTLGHKQLELENIARVVLME